MPGREACRWASQRRVTHASGVAVPCRVVQCGEWPAGPAGASRNYSEAGIVIPRVAPLIVAFTSLTAVHADRPIRTVDEPVKFVEYTETGKWNTWSDGRLSIRLPEGWIVAVDAQDVNASHASDKVPGLTAEAQWKYRIIAPNERTVVLTVTLQEGGPDFMECFCAHKKDFDFSEKDGFRFWAISFPDFRARVFKVATKTMRLDIHASLPRKNSERIRYIVESARPIEHDGKAAK
jgi:hypothetical protein